VIPPAQQQSPPGVTGAMEPEPHDEMAGYTGRGLLDGKVALVTGASTPPGSSGPPGGAVTVRGDLADAAHCRAVVDRTR
jgi:hypothetical protein